MNVTIAPRDTVATAKRKLSQSLSVRSSDITLVFKYRIMFDDKSVSDYNIASDQYVLWFLNDDDSQCSSQTGRSGVVQFQYFNVNRDWTNLSDGISIRLNLPRDPIKLYQDGGINKVNIEIGNLSIDHGQKYPSIGGEKIEVYLVSWDRSVRRYCLLVSRDDKIGVLIHKLLYSDDARFIYQGDYLDQHETFRHYDIDSGDTIQVIQGICRRDERDPCDSGEKIKVYVERSGRTVSCWVSRDDEIGVLRHKLLYSDYDEFIYQSESLYDEYKTFRFYRINSGDTIQVIEEICGGGCVISRSGGHNQIRLVAIETNMRPFYLHYSKSLSYIISALSNKLNYPTSQIKLFQDQSKTKPIQTDQQLHQIIQTNPKQIYFSMGIFYFEKNFTKIKLLDTGSFGKVYKYREIRSNKDFAVKILEISRSVIRESLMKEISILGTLGSHERIVKFVEHIESDDALYLVMEYMAGGSLGSYMKENGALNEPSIKKYSKQVLQGLQHLHYKKILHRDIKGDNILLDENYNAKLADFGLSETLCDIASKNHLNGALQAFDVTAYWMAPEILNGESFGLSADIWSLGATMIEMVTGKHPYYQLNACHASIKIATDKKIPFSCPPNISKKVEDFIKLCLNPEPHQRPTCDELLKIIDKY